MAPAPIIPTRIVRSRGSLELILHTEGIASRGVRDVALSEEQLRARRDVQVSVEVDHRIGQIVDTRLQAEAVGRRVGAANANLRVQNAAAILKVALRLLQQRVPRR